MSDIGIPRIKLPQGAPVPDVVRDIACARFGKAGVMILEDVISPELVAPSIRTTPSVMRPITETSNTTMRAMWAIAAT
jgi:hypothetical protein